MTNLLSKSACRIIAPLKINLNYIEVQPFGTCFDIENKRFVIDPDVLKEASPRAFVKYRYSKEKVPNPTYFIEGINLY